MPETRVHTCMLCEATCGISVQVEGGRVTGVRGDREDPFSRGHLCPKAAAIPDVMDHPDRIREPMRRVGDRWEPLSWDDALAEAAERITAIQRTHGRNAVGLYAGNPTVHGHGAILGIPLLSRALGGRSRFSATSVDQLPQMLAALEMFGHQLLLPVPDVDRTAFFLVLGANPIASNGSLMTAPGIAHRLSALRARGGRLVVVDPRRTETAAVADLHVAVRPGGDAALLLGMLHVILGEGLDRPGRLADFTDGLDRLREIAARHPPERVAGRAGVAPDADPLAGPGVRRLAQRRVLRPGRDLHPGVRRHRLLAGERAQRRDREPRPGRRRHVHHPRRGRRGAERAPGLAGQLRAFPQPGAWTARVRRGASGGDAGGGDRDPGRGPDPRPRHLRRESGALGAQRPPARPRPGRPRVPAGDRPLPERDHAPRPPDPPAHLRAGA